VCVCEFTESHILMRWDLSYLHFADEETEGRQVPKPA
jgi:hypothetical protein